MSKPTMRQRAAEHELKAANATDPEAREKLSRLARCYRIIAEAEARMPQEDFGGAAAANAPAVKHAHG
jgi:hypothetical protein